MAEDQDSNGKYVKWAVFVWALGFIFVAIATLTAQIAGVAAQAQENSDRIQDVRELILERLSTIQSDTAVTKEQIIQIQKDIQDLKIR